MPEALDLTERWARLAEEAAGAWLLCVGEDGSLPAPWTWGGDHDVVGLDPSDSALGNAPCFFLSRAILRASGGFGGLLAGCENLDLVLRLSEAGARFRRPPDWPGSPWGHSPARDLPSLFMRHPTRVTLALALGCGGSPDLATLESAYRDACGSGIPAHPRFTVGELAEYFAERTTPPLRAVEALTERLERVARQGLWGANGSDAPRFDRCQAANELSLHTDLMEAEILRSPLLRYPAPELQEIPWEVTLEGTYTVDIEPDGLRHLGSPRLVLPLPTSCAEQREVQLTHVEPADLEPFFIDAGDSVALPLPESPTKVVRVAYGFRCKVRAGGLLPSIEPVSSPPVRLSDRLQTKLEQMLRAIFGGGQPDPAPRDRAYRIYRWMLQHIPYFQSDRMGPAALELQGGNCQQRVRLFALLARRVGLDVRERAAALAGPMTEVGSDDGCRWARTVVSERGQPLFHVWGEVLLPGLGWLPFDFMGTDCGARRATPQNLPSDSVREWLEAQTPTLEARSFGEVDPYRVHYAAVPRPFMGVPQGQGVEDVTALWQRAWSTRHTLELTLRGLPPENPRGRPDPGR